MPLVPVKKSHLKVTGGCYSQQTLRTGWLFSIPLSVYGKLFYLCGPRDRYQLPVKRGGCLREVKNAQF